MFDSSNKSKYLPTNEDSEIIKRKLFIPNPKSNPKKLEFRRHNNASHQRGMSTIVTLITSSLAAFTLITFTQLIEVTNGQQQQQQQLPTVIVRGFLNYRTTVDGTVLLFTPDAGGSASGQSTQAISASHPLSTATTATTQSQQQQQQFSSSSSMPVLKSHHNIEPTIVQKQPNLASSTTFNLLQPIASSSAAAAAETNGGSPNNDDLNDAASLERGRGRGGAGAGPPDDGGWHHIMTPPLKLPSLQTTFKPSMNMNENENGFQSSSMFTIAAPSSKLLDIVADSAAAYSSAEKSQQKPARLISSGSTNNDQQQQPRPSVQSDDIITINNQPTSPQPASFSQQPAIASTSSPLPRATRPKRPILGFNGQGLRAKAGDGSSQSPTGSIHGLRRPMGITTTTTTTTPAPAANSPNQPPAGAGIAAFQNRLTNASVRMRNKFKRPSLVGQAQQNTTNQQTASLIGDSGDTATSDLMMFSTNSNNQAAAFQSINPDVSQAALSARMGDIFNPGASIGTSPVVGSDEVLVAASHTSSQQTDSAAKVESADSSPSAESLIELPINNFDNNQQAAANGEVLSQPPESQSAKLESRLGDQQLSNVNNNNDENKEPQLLSGGLSGSIDSNANMPLNLEGFFSDQPASSGSDSSASGGQSGDKAAASNNGGEASGSEHHARHHAKADQSSKNNNQQLNKWLDHHHNKFVPRLNEQPQQGHLSQQLAQNPNLLAPSFVSNIPSTSSSSSSSQIKPTTTMEQQQQAVAQNNPKPAVGADDLLTTVVSSSNNNSNESGSQASNKTDAETPAASLLQLQTITKTYSTVMTSFKTRLVPLQVKSSTAIHTITENYVITKLLTTYQTLPAGGEFILPEMSASPSNNINPFEMFNEKGGSSEEKPAGKEQPISVPAAPQVVSNNEPVISQEQPISLEPSTKSANDWLHDFSSNNQQQPSTTNNNLVALLEQQAQEANLAGFPSFTEPLDQLASSSLDPAALLAAGGIDIPDLNNPLVLAAAIQNPQLAAVILAAQQLQLKQRGNNNNNNNNKQQIQPQQQLQPSYSTSFSTLIKPSTYTVRDTMYTTRLVSFKDGRTVRTRTVSEPGQVIEQVLTTMATEITPITLTIRPTGLLSQSSQTLAPSLSGGGQQQAQNSQATINNALIATQLASLLARRQQQIGGNSLANQQSLLNGASGATNPQLAALQQFINQQQRQQQQQQQVKQFQPNLQQLLQSMQSGGPNQAQASQNSLQSSQSLNTQQQAATGDRNNNNNNNQASTNNNPNVVESKKQQEVRQQQQAQAIISSMNNNNSALPTPSLQQLQPITTTLTSLQVRTYTVHNAFKTIYRTITSTQLITSTLFPGSQQRTQTMMMG